MDARSPRYLRLRGELLGLLQSPDLSPGALLPSEGDLAARFGVSRVTLRRALGLLKREGLLSSRQGFGWYVASTPLQQSLDALTAIDEQIAATGRRPGRRLLNFAFGPPPARVCTVLGTDAVLEISRLNLADDHPIGRNTAWLAHELAGDLTIEAAERESLHRLLPVTLGSATQTITAEAASAYDADLLGVAGGVPLLRFNRTTRDSTGRAVLYSEAVYNPLRTEFTIELQAAAAAANESGLRVRRSSSPSVAP